MRQENKNSLSKIAILTTTPKSLVSCSEFRSRRAQNSRQITHLLVEIVAVLESPGFFWVCSFLFFSKLSRARSQILLGLTKTSFDAGLYQYRVGISRSQDQNHSNSENKKRSLCAPAWGEQMPSPYPNLEFDPKFASSMSESFACRTCTQHFSRGVLCFYFSKLRISVTSAHRQTFCPVGPKVIHSEEQGSALVSVCIQDSEQKPCLCLFEILKNSSG